MSKLYFSLISIISELVNFGVSFGYIIKVVEGNFWCHYDSTLSKLQYVAQSFVWFIISWFDIQ